MKFLSCCFSWFSGKAPTGAEHISVIDSSLVIHRKNRIETRLIFMIIAFSSVVTLLISVYELYSEYRQLHADILKEAESLRIYTVSLPESLQASDEAQIQMSLTAMSTIPNIDKVTLYTTENEKPKQRSVGVSKSSYTEVRRYPVETYSRVDRNKLISVGTIEAVVSFDRIYEQIWSRAIAIVLGNLIKTCFVAVFMYFLFRRLISNRLEQIAVKVAALAPSIRRVGEVRAETRGELDELELVSWIVDRSAEALAHSTKENEILLNSLNANVKAYRDQLNFNSQLLTVLPIPIYYVDRSGQYIGVNPAWETMFKLTAKEVVGKKSSSVFDPEVARHFDDADILAWRGQYPRSIEASIANRFGQHMDVTISKAPFMDANGEAAGVVGVIVDITELNNALRSSAEKGKALEQERAELKKRVEDRTYLLKQALDARRLMIANVSHELRTPVNSLRLLVDSSEMEASDKTDILQRIGQITAHMAQLVENLLLLDSESSAPNLNGPIKEFDLGDEIAATCSMLGPLKRESQANLICNVDACIGKTVKGDLMSLRRILINLLTNAFKFTKAGVIRVHATVEEGKAPDTVQCVIRVADTGCGISYEVLDRLFMPFVTNSIEVGQTGTGLGLALSKKLAETMGGDLRLVCSEVGVGSEFACTLQFALAGIKTSHATSNKLEDSRPHFGTHEHPLRVLIAEDDRVTAAALTILIKLLRHTPIHVDNYEELRQVLTDSASNFDVALVDHRLPGGNGLDMIQFCRTHGLAKNTRMFLVTADATSALFERAKKLQIDIITKPTSKSRLEEIFGLSPAVSFPTEKLTTKPITGLD